MTCHGIKFFAANRRAVCIALVGALLAAAPPARAAIIVDDSWTDAGRNNGADAQDTNWWYSTSNQAIEVSAGNLGLVTGSSGRGIHGTFPLQTLSVGDSLKATYTFKTPATVGTNAQAAFRIGLFDGDPGLAADLTASTGSPNALYNNLKGYMYDFDVNFATANIQFRERSVASGQMMAATADFTNLASGGSIYTFAVNTTYTGVFNIARTATGLDMTGSLSQGSTLLSTFTTSDSSPTSTAFDVLAFHVNSGIFGSSATPNTANNGIDFSNIKIEYTPLVVVPEASSIVCFAFVGLMVLAARRLGFSLQ